MTATAPILRVMRRDELDTVLDWAAAEGWNPGLEDADAFYRADPDGFFIAEVDGAPAAAISVVNHAADFAFLGLYICRPDCRGQGTGYALWQHALRHAGQRTVGLDGVPAQQENYRRSGFELVEQTSRFTGVIPHPADGGLRPATAADIAALIRLEAEANGYEKPRFLDTWLRPSPERRTLLRDGGDGIEGFVTVRRCRQGYKLGPLVARTPETAIALLHGAGTITGGEQAMIDLPAENAALQEHCGKLGMQVSFSTARMYRGPIPAARLPWRAIATLELG